jgi:hypothetical protein
MAGLVPATQTLLMAPRIRSAAAAASTDHRCLWVAGTGPAMTIIRRMIEPSA